MYTVKINADKVMGKIKPIHGMENAPVVHGSSGQLRLWKKAGFPFARLHDTDYPRGQVVDIPRIFPNFEADENDPKNYSFENTDQIIEAIKECGAEIIYRLGTSIEHTRKKIDTIVPPDMEKWSRIALNIIRHYNEGWANGYHFDIKYWEIWNEPDLDPDDSTHKRCWGGTAKEFYELYCIAHKHLKACFPHLKIGGPACARMSDDEWRNGFFQALKDNGIYPDFFSWHRYGNDVEKFREKVRLARQMLDRYGFYKTESIFNEWNYVKGWTGDEWIYSLKCEKNIKGATFIAAVMEMCQYEPLDMIMYYYARPCGMNGMFSTDFVCDKLKGYYPFLMFGTLYKLDAAVEVSSDDEDVHLCAAVGENEAAVMLTHYSDDDAKGSVCVRLDLSGFGAAEGCEIEYYLLDAAHDLSFVGRATYFGDRFVPEFEMPNFTSYLIKIKKK